MKRTRGLHDVVYHMEIFISTFSDLTGEINQEESDHDAISSCFCCAWQWPFSCLCRSPGLPDGLAFCSGIRPWGTYHKGSQFLEGSKQIGDVLVRSHGKTFYKICQVMSYVLGLVGSAPPLLHELQD